MAALGTYTLKNFSKGAVLTPSFTASTATLVLNEGHGDRFPAAPFQAVLYDSHYTDPADAYWAGLAEVLTVTAKTNDSLAITRAQEGTAALASSTGHHYNLVLPVTALLLENINPRVENVLAYGATGDGTTDDTSAVQAALDALETSGGVIYFPSPYTFHIDAGRLIYQSSKSITFAGAGNRSKLLWTLPESSDPGDYHYGMINIQGTSDEYADHTERVIIRDLAFDFGGSRAGGWSEYRRGINIFDADNILVTTCYFKGSVGECVGIGNFSSDPSTTYLPRRTIIRDCYFYDCAQDMINPNGYYTLIDNCFFEQGSTPIEAGRSYLTISNCEFRDSTGPAIKLASVQNFSLTGSRFYDCATTNPGSSVGVIHIAGQGSNAPCLDGDISGNVIVNSSNHAWHHAIYVGRGTATSSNARIQIRGNYVYGAENAIYLADLTYSSVRGNLIYGDSSVTAIDIANTAYNQYVTVTSNHAFGTFSYAAFYDETSGQNNIMTGNFDESGLDGLALHGDLAVTGDSTVSGTLDVTGDFTAGGGFRQTVGAFGVDDVAGTVSATAMTGPSTFRWRASRAGSITKLWFQGITVVSGTVTATVYKNGLATALTLTLSTGEASKSTSPAKDTYTFAEGDYLDVYYSASSINPTMDLRAVIEVEQ